MIEEPRAEAFAEGKTPASVVVGHHQKNRKCREKRHSKANYRTELRNRTRKKETKMYPQSQNVCRYVPDDHVQIF
jgi:tRNA G37 N-methylase TrmD